MCAYCMCDVCYAGRYVCRYGMLCRYVCATQCMLCGTGRRDGVRVQGMRYAITCRKQNNLVAMVAVGTQQAKLAKWAKMAGEACNLGVLWSYYMTGFESVL